MYLLIILLVPAVLGLVFMAFVGDQKVRKTASSNREAQNGSFDERGRFVRDVPNKSKIGHIIVDTNKTRTFSRNNEKDLIQDPPLSEAERNVLLGK